MSRVGVTFVWVVYVGFTLFSVLVGRSGGGMLSPLVIVWLDNLSYVLGIAGVLTILVIVLWLFRGR